MTRPFAITAAAALALAATLCAGDAGAAADDGIALSEVAAPPASSGVDQATLKNAAEGEIKRIDSAARPTRWKKRRVLVSVALVKADDAPVAVTINATLREAKTGTMIAIVEGRARAEGQGSSELKKQVAHAAVRSAVRQIPDALAQ